MAQRRPDGARDLSSPGGVASLVAWHLRRGSKAASRDSDHSLVHMSTVIHRRRNRRRDALARLGSAESDGLSLVREHRRESSPFDWGARAEKGAHLASNASERRLDSARRTVVTCLPVPVMCWCEWSGGSGAWR